MSDAIGAYIIMGVMALIIIGSILETVRQVREKAMKDKLLGDEIKRRGL